MKKINSNLSNLKENLFDFHYQGHLSLISKKMMKIMDKKLEEIGNILADEQSEDE